MTMIEFRNKNERKGMIRTTTEKKEIKPQTKMRKKTLKTFIM